MSNCCSWSQSRSWTYESNRIKSNIISYHIISYHRFFPQMQYFHVFPSLLAEHPRPLTLSFTHPSSASSRCARRQKKFIPWAIRAGSLAKANHGKDPPVDESTTMKSLPRCQDANGDLSPWPSRYNGLLTAKGLLAITANLRKHSEIMCI